MKRTLFFLMFCAASAHSQEWIRYTSANSPLPSDQIYALSLGPDNTLWIGTSGGLASLKNGVWSVFDTSNSPLPDPYITSLAVDSAGTVWIGTGFAGAVLAGGGGGVGASAFFSSLQAVSVSKTRHISVLGR